MIPDKMKACMLTSFNKLEIHEVPVPEITDDEVLCKIKSIAICGTDPEIINGSHQEKWPPYFPFRLGHEWAGEIVRTGRNVTGFKVGDRVAGEAHKGCGHCSNCLRGDYALCLNYGNNAAGHRHYGFTAPGANCEYNAYSPRAIKKIPDSFSFDHASLVDTAGVALHGIKLIGITPAGTAAVFGPGPIGLLAAQMAKAMGAAKVIVVGRRHRLKVAGEIGADYLVDFEKEDPVKRIMEITGGKGADEILECSGAHETIQQSVDSVKKGGRISLIGFYDDSLVKITSFTKIVLNEIVIKGSRANPNASEEVIRMFSEGMISADRIVTHSFPLEKYNEALDVFLNRRDGAIKVVVNP
jgi:L-iditol 2-dehydrogenase